MILALARLSSSAVKPSVRSSSASLSNSCFDLCGLGRFGAGIKGEVTGRQSGKILRADVIGQAELFADAQKQPRAEVAARFLNQLQRVTVVVKHRRAGETDDDHGLLFVAGFLDAYGGAGFRRRRPGVVAIRRQDAGASGTRFPVRKRLFHGGFDLSVFTSP